MANYIEITYNAAIKEAKHLESIANEIEKANQSFYSEVLSLDGSWSGEGASAYQRACAQVEKEIASNVTYIRNIAAAIRETAEVYRQSQEESNPSG